MHSAATPLSMGVADDPIEDYLARHLDGHAADGCRA
jgi:hypothetical protein